MNKLELASKKVFDDNVKAISDELDSRLFAIDRLTQENNQLWAIFKTCHGCKHVVPGVLLGCPIQAHIDLSGHCNQYENV